MTSPGTNVPSTFTRASAHMNDPSTFTLTVELNRSTSRTEPCSGIGVHSPANRSTSRTEPCSPAGIISVNAFSPYSTPRFLGNHQE